MIKSLLDSGRALPDLNIQNLAGDTPLHLASRAGHHGIVDLLLCNKADPHIPNVRGYNCMHLAALSGNEKVIDVIARQNKDLLNTRESSGLAPIHLAIYANKPKSLNVSLPGFIQASFCAPKFGLISPHAPNYSICISRFYAPSFISHLRA